MTKIKIVKASVQDHKIVAYFTGLLLKEIMQTVNEPVFKFNLQKTEERARNYLVSNKYWVFLATNGESHEKIGFISLYQSYALYSEGRFGTIPELFVMPKYRSERVGERLVEEALRFAKKKGWHRLEVTTPPLPFFDRTVHFYQQNGFEITGGKKLKIEVSIAR